MATISSPGVGSGLDIQGIINSLMAAERQPLTKITQERTQINTKISIYGIIKNSMNDLQTAATKLSNLGTMNLLSAKSGNEQAFTATASNPDAKGLYNIQVNQLARAQSIASTGVANRDAVVGTGSLTITLGSYDSVGNSFTANADKTPVTINIGPGQQTLDGIRQAINEANAGVSATIVNDGTSARLVLTSTATGEVNGFKLEATDNDGNNTDASGLSMLAYDPTLAAGAGKNATQLQSALNAQFTINNLAITKPSNTVTDAVDGLTLTLKQVTTAPATLEVASDNAAIGKTLDEFVAAYNKIRGNLKDQQQQNATLSKETTPASLERGLREILRETLSEYNLSINDVGLSFNRDGVLSLDKTKLDKAIASDPKVLEKLFGNTGTSTDSRVSFIASGSRTVPGTYNINITTAFDGTNNVEGTIGGNTGVGSGGLMSGLLSSPVDGLNLRIAQGASGNLGSVTVVKGLGSKLSDWIKGLSEEGGALASRTEGLNARLKRLSTQEERLNLRLEQVEKRYRAQFSALDSMLASMQQTSAFLGQQLAALQAQTRG